MQFERQKFRNSVRTVWRAFAVCALAAAAFGFLFVASANAQSASMADLFHDVPAYAVIAEEATAEVADEKPIEQENILVTYVEEPNQVAAQPTLRVANQLQQPGGAQGGAPPAASIPPQSIPVRGAEELPSPRVEGNVPLSGWDANVEMRPGPNGRIERLVVRDASLSKVLSLLAQTYHLNIVAANDIDAVISITLRDVALEEALTAILSVANYTWVDQGGIILITSLADTSGLSPSVQGRCIRIFELDFASATVVSEAATTFLSPIGKLTTVSSDPADSRRTREMIVVEDIPQAIERIAEYVAQVDSPPRQVLIEAHIFQVTLRDNQKNGVNFNALARIAGANVNFKTVGFANPTASPASLITIDGTDLDAVIELLQTTNDTKTLGSPKVLVLNQQEAKVHVGRDIGYQTTVTSELQSTQAPQFLQVGVLLTITPRITRDNRVLLTVHPEVSTGEVDLLTQVPNKETTELDTEVMLRDGQGMIIGGLIDEKDITTQNKVPYLGDLWRVGFLFRKSDITKERREVIIAIVPRIQPYAGDYENFEQGELIRAETPLFHGRLCYVDRPFDVHLPDGKRVAKPYIPPPPIRPEFDRTPCNHCESPWPPYYVPQKPYPRQRLVNEQGGYTDEFGEYRDEHGGEYGGGYEGDCAEPGYADPGYGEPLPTGGPAPDYSGYSDEFTSEFDGGAMISDQP